MSNKNFFDEFNKAAQNTMESFSALPEDMTRVINDNIKYCVETSGILATKDDVEALNEQVVQLKEEK